MKTSKKASLTLVALLLAGFWFPQSGLAEYCDSVHPNWCMDFSGPCSNDADCPESFCSPGTCNGGDLSDWPCAPLDYFGICTVTVMTPGSGNLCRTDEDCPVLEKCLIPGHCADGGGLEPYNTCFSEELKACSDSLGVGPFCNEADDCTATGATCDPVFTCVGPSGCSESPVLCFTNNDCEEGETCTGDPICCDSACEAGDYCPGGICETCENPPDSDGDGVPDASDNCPTTANPDQINYDGDGFGEACDCDDSNPNVNPGMKEIPRNGIDDDCNPNTPPPPWNAPASVVDAQYKGSSDIANYLFLLCVPIATLLIWKGLRRKR